MPDRIHFDLRTRKWVVPAGYVPARNSNSASDKHRRFLQVQRQVQQGFLRQNNRPTGRQVLDMMMEYNRREAGGDGGGNQTRVAGNPIENPQDYPNEPKNVKLKKIYSTEDLTDRDLKLMAANHLRVQIQGHNITIADLKGSQRVKDAVDKGVIPKEYSHAGDPTFIGRGFDLIQRPAQAVVGAVEAATNTPKYNKSLRSNLRYVNPLLAVVDPVHPASSVEDLVKRRLPEAGKKFAKGYWGTGKDQIGAEVLQKNYGRKPGALTALQGMAIDIGADPTTYATLATAPAVKNFLKGEYADTVVGRELQSIYDEARAQGLGKRAAEERMAAAVKSNRSLSKMAAGPAWEREVRTSEPIFTNLTERSKVAAEGRAIRKADALAAGETLTKEQLDKAGQEFLKAKEDATLKANRHLLDDEIRAREALRKKQVEIKIGNKTVISSPGVGKVINAPISKFKATKAGAWFDGAFHTAATNDPTLLEMHNAYLHKTQQMYEDDLNRVQAALTGSSRAERKDISHSIEADTKAGFYSKELERDVRPLSGTTSDMYDRAIELDKEFWDREKSVGLHQGEEYNPNDLLHHYYNRDFSRGVGTELQPSRYGNKYFDSLAKAKKGGARPIEDIADILAHRAAKSHQDIAEHLFYQDVADKFGIQLKGKQAGAFVRMAEDPGGDALISANKIAGLEHYKGFADDLYFDQNVADGLSKLRSFTEKNQNVTQFFDFFDKIQAKWKFLVIGPNPGAQLRNLQGDIFNNMLDGVVNPHVYDLAGGYVTGHGLNRTFKAGNHTLSGHDILAYYDADGLRTGFMHGEANLVPTLHGRVPRAAGNVVRRVSETREDFTRMAHYIDAIKKEAPLGGDLREITARAAQRVKKFNFDYNDLTYIERKVFRRIVPFYTYLRKNMPLMLGSFAMRPGRLAVVPKANRALQQLLGQSPDESPFPGGIQNVYPQWVTETQPILLRPGTRSRDALFWQPDLPIYQTQDWLGGLANYNQGWRAVAQPLWENAVEQSTPGFAFGSEAFGGRNPGTGAEVTDDLPQLLIQQTPITKTLNDVITGGKASDSRLPYIKHLGRLNQERTFNFLTGAAQRQITPERIQSELRRRQDIVDAQYAKLKAELEKRQKRKK